MQHVSIQRPPRRSQDVPDRAAVDNAGCGSSFRTRSWGCDTRTRSLHGVVGRAFSLALQRVICRPYGDTSRAARSLRSASHFGWIHRNRTDIPRNTCGLSRAFQSRSRRWRTRAVPFPSIVIGPSTFPGKHGGTNTHLPNAITSESNELRDTMQAGAATRGAARKEPAQIDVDET